MRRGEGIIDVEVAERREFTSESDVVGLLGRMEAEILQQPDITVGELGHHRLGRRADAIGGESDRLAAQRGLQRRRERRQGQFRRGLSVGPAEMGHDDDPRTGTAQLMDRRCQPVDAGRVRHPAIAHGNVEIGA